MGGEVSADLTHDITHLIASKAGSEKYKVCLVEYECPDDLVPI